MSGLDVEEVCFKSFSMLVSRVEWFESIEVCRRVLVFRVLGGVSLRLNIDCMGLPLDVNVALLLDFNWLLGEFDESPTMAFCSKSGKSMVRAFPPENLLRKLKPPIVFEPLFNEVFNKGPFGGLSTPLLLLPPKYFFHIHFVYFLLFSPYETNLFTILHVP